jgi:hypothetical protein
MIKAGKTRENETVIGRVEENGKEDIPRYISDLIIDIVEAVILCVEHMDG